MRPSRTDYARVWRGRFIEGGEERGALTGRMTVG